MLPGSQCRVDGGVVSGPLEGRGLRLSIGAVDWQARDAALVYVEEEWGPLAASGRVYLVVERDGAWTPDPDYLPPCLWLR